MEPSESSESQQAHQSGKDGGRRRAAVLILGMHRSGTSALTRMLSLLGCELPKHLLEAGDGNELGHWESDKVRWFNEDLLRGAGSHWNDWLPVQLEQPRSPGWTSLVEKGRALLRGEFGEAALFVMKDPRICRLVDFWIEVLHAEAVEPLIIIAIRNPLEVAKSLFARNGINESFCLLIWLRHVLEAERSTRGLRRLVTSYDDLLADWGALAARLEKGFGLAWPCRSPVITSAIEGFLATDHRHHVVPTGALSVSTTIAPWIVSTYAILQRWAQTSEDQRDFAALDAIREALDAAAPAFSGIVSAAAEQEHRIAEDQWTLQELREELGSALSQVGESAAELSRMSARGDVAQAELTSLHARLRYSDRKLQTYRDDLTLAKKARADALLRSEKAMALASRAEAERLSDKQNAHVIETQLGEVKIRLAVAQRQIALLNQINSMMKGEPRWRCLLPGMWRWTRRLRRLEADSISYDDSDFLAQKDVFDKNNDPAAY